MQSVCTLTMAACRATRRLEAGSICLWRQWQTELDNTHTGGKQGTHGTAPRLTRKESESVLNREEVLSAVFPDQEGSADVHIERSDDTELRNFHTLVQQL